MHGNRLQRADRLKKINDILAEYRLPPWEDRHLGDAAEGQCEIIDLVDMAELGPRRVALTLRMRESGGAEHDVSLRFGGAVVYVVPLLNLLEGEDASSGPMLCLAKRWRIEHGEWSMELPHALVAEDDLGGATDALDSPAHRVLAATFGGVCIESLTAAKILPLGSFKVKGEARPAEAYLFAATVLKPFMRKRGDGAIVKLAWTNAAPIIEGGAYLTEPVTAAALWRALYLYPPDKRNTAK
ncbi:MAG: hypothetical protein RL272_1034 [Candidatus Parcubacteria bacterium]|jgi:hypothetical protein